jgi:hypothetical protein
MYDYFINDNVQLSNDSLPTSRPILPVPFESELENGLPDAVVGIKAGVLQELFKTLFEMHNCEVIIMRKRYSSLFFYCHDHRQRHYQRLAQELSPNPPTHIAKNLQT